MTDPGRQGIVGPVDFDRLYRGLRVAVAGLPECVDAFGEVWERRAEFHVSVFSADRLGPLVAERLGVGEAHAHRRLEAARELVDAADLQVRSLGPGFRLARREERRTLIVEARVDGLDELYVRLSDMVGMPLPVPPAHVTLYCAPGGKAIGLASEDELERLSRMLTRSEREEIVAAGVAPVLRVA
jgi:hypothetical protein